MISLSLCMIVKNEEKVLPRILKPMKEIVDKILICDTGSTDRTKEIIREFTAEVYDFPWKNDFSAARNFISEKVSTDYWMWLDADDMITQENLYRLKQLKETLSPNTDMVMMDYVTDFDEWNHAAFSCYRERILKTSRNFRWRGRRPRLSNISDNSIHRHDDDFGNTVCFSLFCFCRINPINERLFLNVTICFNLFLCAFFILHTQK